MALATVFAALTDRCAALAKALDDAHWAVAEGKPDGGHSYLVERLGDAILAVAGAVRHAESAADAARQATGYPADVERARHALLECHRRFDPAAGRLASELLCYEAIHEVVSVRKTGPTWRRWSAEVRKALALCDSAADAVRSALLACWQELAERAGGTAVTVRATGIGRIMTARAHADGPAPGPASADGAADGAAGGRGRRGDRGRAATRGAG